MNLYLGFQVWDAVGWVGQALFFIRMLHQWIVSERAGKSLLPTAFWWYSVVATLFLIVYQLHRQDPVFLAGFLVNGAIYVRNLVLTYRPRPPKLRTRAPWIALFVGLLAFTGVLVMSLAGTQKVVRFEADPIWLGVGFLAQSLWSSRFVIQWMASEKAGQSVLPASFFRVSIAGAIGLFAYAVHQVDWVMMAAYLLNPIPYVRNLMLLSRQREAESAAEAQ